MHEHFHFADRPELPYEVSVKVIFAIQKHLSEICDAVLFGRSVCFFGVPEEMSVDVAGIMARNLGGNYCQGPS